MVRDEYTRLREETIEDLEDVLSDMREQMHRDEDNKNFVEIIVFSSFFTLLILLFLWVVL